jgi:hypothetical protein
MFADFKHESWSSPGFLVLRIVPLLVIGILVKVMLLVLGMVPGSWHGS